MRGDVELAHAARRPCAVRRRGAARQQGGRGGVFFSSVYVSIDEFGNFSSFVHFARRRESVRKALPVAGVVACR